MAAAGDAASILAAGAAQAEGGNVTPPGGLRPIPDGARDGEGGELGVLIDDPPLNPYVSRQAPTLDLPVNFGRRPQTQEPQGGQ